MTEPTLPDWAGDKRTEGLLIVGNLHAIVGCNRSADSMVQNDLIPDECEWSVDIWREHDQANDGWLFRSQDHDGEIIGGDMARAICEAVIRQALLADAAEAKLDEVLATAGPVVADLAKIAREMTTDQSEDEQA